MWLPPCDFQWHLCRDKVKSYTRTREKRNQKHTLTFTGENFTRQYGIKEMMSFSFTDDFKRSMDKTSEISPAHNEVHSLCQFISVQKLTLQFRSFFQFEKHHQDKGALKTTTLCTCLCLEESYSIVKYKSKRHLTISLCPKVMWFLSVSTHPLHQLRH